MPEPDHEQPGTYAIQHDSNEEVRRLQLQDQMVTEAQGGVPPEHADPTRLECVLDIGCGSGGWLIATARAYPHLTQLVGVDINEKMLNYARQQAAANQVTDRVKFRQMDGLGPLDFPDASFDLVNERFAVSWLRTWDWPTFLQECQRVTRPGGVIRLTESNGVTESTSSAMVRLNEVALAAFHQSGYYFTPDADGATKELAHLLRKLGLQNVQTQTHISEYCAGTPQGQRMAEDWKHLYRALIPLLHKWTRVPDDYEEIYQQMLSEMQQPNFVAIWSFLTAWGTKLADFSSENISTQ